jgi:hypothetical protein
LFFLVDEHAEQQQQQEGEMELSLNSILQRARANGSAGPVTVDECMYLKQHLDASQAMPTLCERLLEGASKAGLLKRRDSRIARTWDITEGHGVRKVGQDEPVPGGVFDHVSNPAIALSAHDIYLSKRSPEEKEKIRKLIVRTASKGGRPRVDMDEFFAKSENQQSAVMETRKEIQRHASRLKEIQQRDIQVK